MKGFREQNFYELLDVPADASKAQIERAYQLAKHTYGKDSLASYSLMSPDERQAIMARLEEAYQTLSNAQARRDYERAVGLLRPLGQPSPEPAELIPEPLESAEQPVQERERLDGSDLKTMRERRRIPLQEIATRTRINITYLQYIEENRWKDLPAPVYLRSYIIQYARALGIDSERAAALFMKTLESIRPPEAPH